MSTTQYPPVIPVFWMEPTDRVLVRLRTYWKKDDHAKCPSGHPWCDGQVTIEPSALASAWHEPAPTDACPRGYRTREELVSETDPRWPYLCDHCGRVIPPDDAVRQVWADTLHARSDGGPPTTLQEAPVGAMWDADHMHGEEPWCGPDGRSVHVKTPGGDWCIDSEASNCTRSQWADVGEGRRRWSGRTHQCWIRHGDPTDPQGTRGGRKFHVDKSGETCAAGAGSIQAGPYHGFLHDGALRQC